MKVKLVEEKEFRELGIKMSMGSGVGLLMLATTVMPVPVGRQTAWCLELKNEMLSFQWKLMS